MLHLIIEIIALLLGAYVCLIGLLIGCAIVGGIFGFIFQVINLIFGVEDEK